MSVNLGFGEASRRDSRMSVNLGFDEASRRDSRMSVHLGFDEAHASRRDSVGFGFRPSVLDPRMSVDLGFGSGTDLGPLPSSVSGSADVPGVTVKSNDVNAAQMNRANRRMSVSTTKGLLKIEEAPAAMIFNAHLL
jgi:hypothetical protein